MGYGITGTGPDDSPPLEQESNANADALSRCPLPHSGDANPTCELVAAITEDDRGEVGGVDGDGLKNLQREDVELARMIRPIIRYLEDRVLPGDDPLSKWIAVSSSQYTMLDGVLYRVESDATLRVIPLECARKQLFTAANSGKFGGHLSDTKELRRHMRSDIAKWTRSCLICTSYSTGRKVKLPLTPIPVSGAFDRVGVDVLQYPRTNHGNRYAIVFVDYLTKWPEVYAAPYCHSATCGTSRESAWSAK